MPDLDPNHLAHQQPDIVMIKAAGFRSQPPDHSSKNNSRSSGCRARQTMHSRRIVDSGDPARRGLLAFRSVITFKLMYARIKDA
eukprot:6178264-Pleurochrysis_carterae.AAC.1